MIKKSLLFLTLIFLCTHGFATETKLMVRAKAKDAKFVGSSLGGAHVIVRNTVNGLILAEGTTVGSTGNTDLIMKTPKDRYTQLADDKTAGFLAIIDIDEPTFVQIEVTSPFNKKNAQVAASTELWMIPGKDILGDGIVLEIPGFIIDILSPNTHQYIPLTSLKKNGLEIKTNIVMMCGCPIEEGGLWDSKMMEVTAILKKDGKIVTELPLKNPSRNLFGNYMPISEAGTYELTVIAYNAITGNTGVEKVNYVITD